MTEELDISANLGLPDICHQEQLNQIKKPTLGSSSEIIDSQKDEEISAQDTNSTCLNCDQPLE